MYSADAVPPTNLFQHKLKLLASLFNRAATVHSDAPTIQAATTAPASSRADPSIASIGDLVDAYIQHSLLPHVCGVIAHSIDSLVQSLCGTLTVRVLEKWGDAGHLSSLAEVHAQALEKMFAQNKRDDDWLRTRDCASVLSQLLTSFQLLDETRVFFHARRRAALQEVATCAAKSDQVIGALHALYWHSPTFSLPPVPSNPPPQAHGNMAAVWARATSSKMEFLWQLSQAQAELSQARQRLSQFYDREFVKLEDMLHHKFAPPLLDHPLPPQPSVEPTSLRAVHTRWSQWIKERRSAYNLIHEDAQSVLQWALDILSMESYSTLTLPPPPRPGNHNGLAPTQHMSPELLEYHMSQLRLSEDLVRSAEKAAAAGEAATVLHLDVRRASEEQMRLAKRAQLLQTTVTSASVRDLQALQALFDQEREQKLEQTREQLNELTRALHTVLDEDAALLRTYRHSLAIVAKSNSVFGALQQPLLQQLPSTVAAFHRVQDQLHSSLSSLLHNPSLKTWEKQGTDSYTQLAAQAFAQRAGLMELLAQGLHWLRSSEAVKLAVGVGMAVDATGDEHGLSADTVMNDPLVIGVAEPRNKHATALVKRVKMKLEGREVISQQVILHSHWACTTTTTPQPSRHHDYPLDCRQLISSCLV